MGNWLGNIFGKKQSNRDTYEGLWAMALGTNREAIGLAEPPANAPIWGALMELGMNITVTIVSIGDGTTSMYTGAGGGVLGGHSHESVRAANAMFLETINRAVALLEPCTSYPEPPANHVTFYGLTDAGIVTATASQGLLESGSHPLSPLFMSGHGVITQLRLIVDGPVQK